MFDRIKLLLRLFDDVIKRNESYPHRCPNCDTRIEFLTTKCPECKMKIGWDKT